MHFWAIVKSQNFTLSQIESKIYFIRGEKVMLDEDLAELYGVSTRELNQAVKRNLERFPIDFMFSLSYQEFTRLMSQIVISKNGRGGRRKVPLAFTEQGVAMLSSVLKSERAVDVNIAIMRAFVKLRSVLDSNQEFKKQLEALEKKYDGQFQDVFAAIKELMSEREVPLKRIVGLNKKN